MSLAAIALSSFAAYSAFLVILQQAIAIGTPSVTDLHLSAIVLAISCA